MLICSGLFLCKKLMTKGKAGNEMYTLQNPARFISYGADKVDTGNLGAKVLSLHLQKRLLVKGWGTAITLKVMPKGGRYGWD